MVSDLPPVAFLGPAPPADVALATLAEPVRLWFSGHIGEPTPVQRLAWPALARGDNLLIAAPTGAGKTLAAFAPILGELLTGPLTSGIRCLAVAPLKALTSDVRKNLRQAVRGAQEHLPEGWGRIRVGVRTGDTPERVRRHQRRAPPDVLLTTPESLAVLLSQRSAAALFGSLRWVVVDEVHALAAGKRGADLAVSLERLERLAGLPLQRVGMSATCSPLDEAARFLVGVGRPCCIASAGATGALELRVEPLAEGPSFVATLATRLEPELRTNRSTLVFTNTRALAEKVSWRLRHQFPEWADAIAVHHASLAPARRRRVERAFRQGRLRTVVTSTSLELGIDIGSVDGVVLVHPPGDVARLLQRVGRSGHGPGRERRGLILTASPAELLEAAVAGASGRAAELEPLHVPPGALDVLCQQLAGMGMEGPWAADDAFALVRRSWPYRALQKSDFDACLAYLLGRRSSNDEEWLPPRLAEFDGLLRIVDDRTARLLRRNLGTIVAEEPRVVRLSGGSAVGDVEEAFAERLQPGDRFLLDGRCLEYRRSEGNHVVVDEVFGRPAVPRWGGGGMGLSPELARRLYLLRVRAAEALRCGPAALAALLRDEYALAEPAVADLAAYFEEQERVSEIPDALTLLIEVVPRQGAADCYLHTPLTRAGNDALTRVAVHRLLRDGRATFSLVADLGWHLSFAGREPDPEAWRRLLSADGFDADLAEALCDSDALRSRFERVAQTGLMLLRNPLGRKPRVGGPDWGARRLFDRVRGGDPECVLLRQAETEVRQEVCDAAAARAFAAALPRRTLRVRRLPRLSPFVEGWTQVAPGPTGGAETPEEALRRLHAALTGTPQGGAERTL